MITVRNRIIFPAASLLSLCLFSVVHVAAAPYLKVFGGDVMVGSGFGAGCTAVNSSARVLVANRGSGGGFLGSGTNSAVFALGVIDGLASANSQSGAKSLTFSNTDGDPNYGGNFGRTYCAADYWASAPASPPNSMTIAPTVISEGEQKVTYVDGKVTINGDVTYQNPGSWSDLSDVPSFYLIARGDIYINADVTNLDGVYVAVPNDSNNDGDFNDPGEGGNIYTCTNGSALYGASVPTSAVNGCGQKLTVNGAFIANRVKFLRTKGDDSAAVANESPASANIAEVFVYGPELWAR